MSDIRKQKPPTLVVLQLTGGNDMLNTIVPYGDPLYYDNRKTVRIAEEDVLHIDTRVGFNPPMRAIKPFWEAGKMPTIPAVGYPSPTTPHSRPRYIWYTSEP